MNAPYLKKLILSGKIKIWNDIYKYCSVYELCELFGRSDTHWNEVRKDPLKLQIQDMFKITEVLRITKKQFYGLVGGGD